MSLYREVAFVDEMGREYRRKRMESKKSAFHEFFLITVSLESVCLAGYGMIQMFPQQYFSSSVVR